MRILVLLFLMFGFSACSTYREERISEDFPQSPDLATFQFNSQRTPGAIYNVSAPGMFASDPRAYQTGDILTVLLSESFSATKSSAAATAKTDAYGLTLPNVNLDIPFIGAGNLLTDGNKLTSGTEQSFQGSGQAAQSNSLTGLISVIVTRVYDNGILAVRGQKHLTLNQGDEYIRITGLVRPEDIAPNNIVSSDRIANAKISYVGAGGISDSDKTGWLSKILRAFSPI
jgi:flagellar L-ring protein precursor FlgH